MDIWPILLLAAGLMAFIVYLLIVVSRLFFIKKEAITFGTAILLFISFVLVASSFYMVLTEKNGILPLKNMTLSKAEQLSADEEKMQGLEQDNNKMKTDLLNSCLQREGVDMFFEKFPFQVIDVSLLEKEWGGQEETLFTETNIVARFSLGDDDVILIEDAVDGSSEKALMERSDLESLDKDVLESCLSEIGELE